MGNAGQSGGIGDCTEYRPFQEFLRIEDIIDFFVFQQPIRVDPRSGYIEILAYKRCSGRNLITDFLLIILCQLCDHCGIHTVQIAFQLGILKNHCFQRRISGTLANAKKRSIDTGTAVKPCSSGIAHRLIKVVMPMPFNQLMGHACMGMNGIDNPLHTSGNHGPRKVDPISHGIAGPDLNGDPVFLHQLHQLQTKRNNIPVNIGSGNILQVTAGTDPLVQTFLNHT